MNRLQQLASRLRTLFTRRKLDADMNDELRAHVEMQTQENIANGLSPVEARYAALRQFGHADGIKEACREQRGLGWVENLVQDLRFAARMMRRNAGSTLVIVLTLGLVIGVCSTLFTAVNYQLFRPLPVEAPDQLVRLSRSNERSEKAALMNAARFAEYRRQSRSFAGLTAMNSQSMTLTGSGEAQRFQATTVTPNLFAVFGIKPALGRGFDATMDVDAQAHQVVLDYGTWRSDFNQDSNILGQTLVLNQQAYTVIGVMPKDLGRVELAWGTDLWIPGDFTRPTEPQAWFKVVGRLKPDVTLDQARTELLVIGRSIEKANDPTGAYDRATAESYLQSHVKADEIMSAVFFIMTVVFVLLIACVNVTNLLIARALTRRRELAVRLSLGAGRGRLIRQLLSEFGALGLLGGLLGLVLAKWTADFIAARGWAEVAFDWRVILFTAGIALFAGLISGLAPALKFSKPNLTDALKEGGLATSFGRGHHRLRNGLVIGQVAMVLVLLITSGLMIRSFFKLGHADPGYDPQNVATIGVQLADQEYPDQEAKRLFVQQALENLRAVPGVTQVGLTSLGAVARNQGGFPFRIQGQVAEDNRSLPSAAINSVNSDFFDLVNARVLRGRMFNDADVRSGAGVVVVNETLAKKYFASEDPVGRFIEMRESGATQPYQVIGVVGDLKNIAFQEEAFAELFVPYQQAVRFWMSPYFMVRTAADPRALPVPLREALLAINRNQPVGKVSLITSQILQLRTWNHELRYLMSFFGALGFALSMIGIYGVVSYMAAERTREIGLRLAIGALRRDILLLIFRQSLRLVAIGGAIGVVLALATTFVLDNLLYAVSPLDPVTYLSVLALVTLTSLLASFVPARRAANTDPMLALRQE